MAASVQAVNGLEKITTELKRSECRVFFDAEDLEESTKFQRVYNSINTQQVDKQTLFNPEVISETI
jgi:hypothetical protein